VDAIRLFLVASSDVSVPRRFDEKVIRELAGRFLITLKNIYSGSFALYANFGWRPSKADPPIADRPPMDRWILARLSRVERTVDEALEKFDATTARACHHRLRRRRRLEVVCAPEQAAHVRHRDRRQPRRFRHAP